MRKPKHAYKYNAVVISEFGELRIQFRRHRLFWADVLTWIAPAHDFISELVHPDGRWHLYEGLDVTRQIFGDQED